MTNKKKEFVYNLFYHKYDMIGKFNYVVKVMRSCIGKIENEDDMKKSLERLRVAYDWGEKAIGKCYVSISKELENKYDICGSIETAAYAYNRTKELNSLLTSEYTLLLKNLHDIKKDIILAS